jgi:hypothetical protein
MKTESWLGSDQERERVAEVSWRGLSGAAEVVEMRSVVSGRREMRCMERSVG